MIILVVKKSDTYCPQAEQIVQDYPDAVISSYKQFPDSELLEAKPALIVLTHPQAVLQTRNLRAAATDEHPNLRILVVLPETLATQATNARIAGANSCIVSPFPTELLKQTIYDECTVFRRLVDTTELLTSNPTIANRYFFQSILGAGRHSVTILASDQLNANHPVTIKLLRQAISATAAFMNEFMANAEKLKNASSENYARIIDAGSWKGYGYLASDIGRCENLYSLLNKHPLPESEISKIGLALTRALMAVKKCGRIHFDIKPENVLYDHKNNSYILSEFGLLTSFAAPDSSGNYFWPEAAYTCPEVFAESSWLTIRSDIYALGVLLYTCLTRQHPFLNRPCTADDQHPARENCITFTEEDLANYSPALTVTIEGMTNVDPDMRPRLRELETIFFLDSKKPRESQVVPPTPGEKTEAISTTPPAAGLDTTPVAQPVHAPAAAGTDRAQAMRPAVKTPAPATMGKLAWWRDRKAQLRTAVASIAALIILTMAFKTGYYRAGKRLRPNQFQGGPLQIFTCLDGHTKQIRTLDLRNVKCPICDEHTTPSFTCRMCKAVFGLPAWPRRDMTEQECTQFAQQQKVCPFCDSTDIVPTPLKQSIQK